ncbi:hypothetical protein CPS_3055 [Colwellia psychrerythraea 34H]|uniref:Uncharacterized protein n=1 Tax=Colwellia psychrerythraea (strain 34H / ATCC BAA-681) TaxID=167879 RepID=Q47ZL7_COLP3|nr:hypothetical protein CPS_3055 [Colwellia psychrerythraea 34H]
MLHPLFKDMSTKAIDMPSIKLIIFTVTYVISLDISIDLTLSLRRVSQANEYTKNNVFKVIL